MTTEREYDPKFGITAGELRACGFGIPDDIPDVAWVPRSSFCPVNYETVESSTTQGVVEGRLEFVFLEPFRWFRATVEIDDDHGNSE